MHEVSIAMSIVDLAEEEALNRGGLRVVAVHMRLGTLTGVVKDALLSSYEIASHDTTLAGSRLVIEDVPGMVYCPACAALRPVVALEWFSCSTCGGVASEIVQGKDMEVVSLEVEE